MGGHSDNPTYREVCSGLSGHAEVAQIEFDPNIISFETLLKVFWSTHDPTTLNQQGHDKGTQYRSAIFYHSDDQKKIAEESLIEVASKLWSNQVVTEITKASTFYEAEKYHQDYYLNNPNQGYCRAVINPKMIKFKEQFKDLLKAQ